MKILIVDDDKAIVDFLSVFLVKEGYETCCCFDGKEAIEKVKSNKFNLILMDVMMPKLDGYEVAQEIRKFNNVPIIFLTARDNQQDKIKGFISGCDDYITKPFDLVELVLRITAILKRGKTISDENDKNIIIIRDLKLNMIEHTLYKDERELSLTPKEFEILSLLAKNKGRVFSSEEIYERIWQERFLENDNSLLTHIRNLREKIGDTVKNSKYIKTIWGVGYKIEKED